MSRNLLLSWSTVGFLLAMSGCTSVIGRHGVTEKQVANPPYAATAIDLSLVREGVADPDAGGVAMAVYGVVDAPLSFVLDTVMLPSDVIKHKADNQNDATEPQHESR